MSCGQRLSARRDRLSLVLLHDLVTTARAVAGARARNAKIALVSALLTAAADDPDAARQVSLVADHLAGVVPQRRLGVGWRGLSDLPAPAAEPTLTVLDVDAAFQALHDTLGTGAGSSGERRRVLEALFSAATEDEQRWLVGLITGETRQGALDGVMQVAIARAAEVPEKAVRRAVMLAGSTAVAAEAALLGGEPALAAIGLEVGRGLRPMLAGSAPDVTAAMAAIAPGSAVAIESKLDGIRLQIHLDHGRVRLFTRSLDDVTDRMPDVVAQCAQVDAATAAVDAEVIALRGDGRPESFQVTGSRTATAQTPDAAAEQVPLSVVAFDLLHRDGVDLLDEPEAQRWEALRAVVPAAWLVPRLVTEDPTRAAAFFAERVAAGHEGVVVKDLEAPYAAGRRGSGWTKVKPRHTLDLVVLAVERGSGRRRGTWSNIHLGARGADGEPVMVGKTFKGMTDAILAWQTETFPGFAVDPGAAQDPATWVLDLRPEQVVEVAVDGIQRSTRYPGGLALRFARVLRYRDDKPVSEIDTIEQVRALGPGSD